MLTAAMTYDLPLLQSSNVLLFAPAGVHTDPPPAGSAGVLTEPPPAGLCTVLLHGNAAVLESGTASPDDAAVLESATASPGDAAVLEPATASPVVDSDATDLMWLSSPATAPVGLDRLPR